MIEMKASLSHPILLKSWLQEEREGDKTDKGLAHSYNLESSKVGSFLASINFLKMYKIERSSNLIIKNDKSINFEKIEVANSLLSTNQQKKISASLENLRKIHIKSIFINLKYEIDSIASVMHSWSKGAGCYYVRDLIDQSMLIIGQLNISDNHMDKVIRELQNSWRELRYKKYNTIENLMELLSISSHINQKLNATLFSPNSGCNGINKRKYFYKKIEKLLELKSMLCAFDYKHTQNFDSLKACELMKSLDLPLILLTTGLKHKFSNTQLIDEINYRISMHEVYFGLPPSVRSIADKISIKTRLAPHVFQKPRLKQKLARSLSLNDIFSRLETSESLNKEGFINRKKRKYSLRDNLKCSERFDVIQNGLDVMQMTSILKGFPGQCVSSVSGILEGPVGIASNLSKLKRANKEKNYILQKSSKSLMEIKRFIGSDINEKIYMLSRILWLTGQNNELLMGKRKSQCEVGVSLLDSVKSSAEFGVASTDVLNDLGYIGAGLDLTPVNIGTSLIGAAISAKKLQVSGVDLSKSVKRHLKLNSLSKTSNSYQNSFRKVLKRSVSLSEKTITASIDSVNTIGYSISAGLGIACVATGGMVLTSTTAGIGAVAAVGSAAGVSAGLMLAKKINEKYNLLKDESRVEKFMLENKCELDSLLPSFPLIASEKILYDLKSTFNCKDLELLKGKIKSIIELFDRSVDLQFYNKGDMINVYIEDLLNYFNNYNDEIETILDGNETAKFLILTELPVICIAAILISNDTESQDEINRKLLLQCSRLSE